MRVSYQWCDRHWYEYRGYKGKIYYYRMRIVIRECQSIWALAGRGRGGGRIAAPIEGQVPIATQGRDKTVPLDAIVIHGDVQDRVEGDGLAQAPPSTIATPVLQDTLARMLGLLEGMAQAGTLPVTSDAPQTYVGGQTLDSMVAPGSHTPKTQPTAVVAPCLDSVEFPGIASHLVATSGVPFQKVVDVAKELEMIRCEGFEQREGKMTRHVGDYGGAPLRSRAYLGRGYHSQSSRPSHAAIPTSEAGYTGHNSSSWVHTSQGLSFRPVGRGGHSGHSGFSHQPTSRKGCFECGDMRHFVRDCPRTRRGGLHQGSQPLTFRAAQPQTRG
ncbi:hypothetical protein H5410_038029, partial [Solanum commersonii]